MTVAYFGVPPTQKDKSTTSASLKAQGINLLRVSPSGFFSVMISFCLYPMFALYVSCLSAVIYTLSTAKPVSLTRPGYILSSRHPRPLPLNYPPICVGIKKISASLRDELERSGFYEQEIRGKVYLLSDHPDVDDINLLLNAPEPTNDFDMTNFCPFGSINLQAVIDLSQAITLLSYCCSALNIDHHVEKPRPSRYLETLGQVDISEEAGEHSEGSTRPRTLIPETGGTSQFALFFDNAAGLVSALPKLPMTRSVKLPYAWSTAPGADVISLPGICFSFVPDLAKFDEMAVPSFIERYMLKNLDSTAEAQFESIRSLRGSFGLIGKTAVGDALSHLVKCLELSIQGQGRPVPIFSDDFYEGTAIYGHGLTYHSAGQTIRSSTAEAMSRDLIELSAHARAVHKIKEICGWEIDAEETADAEVNNKAFDGMVPLHRYLLKGNYSQAQRREITRCANDLRFGTPVLKVNTDTLCDIFKIYSGENDLPTDYPLNADQLFSDDLVAKILSGFGKFPPSFMIPNGRLVPLNKAAPPKAPPSASTAVRAGTKKPSQINNSAWIVTVRRVSLDQALLDFQEMVRCQAFKTVSSSTAVAAGHWVGRGKAFTQVWEHAKAALRVGNEPEDIDGPGSRKRMLSPDDDEEGGAPLSAKRVMRKRFLG